MRGGEGRARGIRKRGRKGAVPFHRRGTFVDQKGEDVICARLQNWGRGEGCPDQRKTG